MSHSIRLFLARRLQRIADHIAKDSVEPLRGGEVHPHSHIDAGFRCGSGINDRLHERQVHDPVELTGLADHVDKLNGSIVAGNHPSLITQLDRLAGSQNGTNFVSHQKFPPQQNVDFCNLNQRSAAVESSSKRRAGA